MSLTWLLSSSTGAASAMASSHLSAGNSAVQRQNRCGVFALQRFVIRNLRRVATLSVAGFGQWLCAMT